MTMKDISIPSERLDVFLKEFGQRVSSASETRPCVRCWKMSDLQKEISAIVREKHAELKSNFPPAIKLIEQLEAIGWLFPVATSQSKASPQASRFFLVDMEAGNNPIIDPFELLMASIPNGIVSYFSALSFYGLTTQTPPFYHIGRLVKHADNRPLSAEEQRNAPKMARPVRDPLGTALFSFKDKVYYSTKRDESSVPGIQMRVMSPRSWIRITTKEQALLDALCQPMRCGGPAVVLEAWDTSARDALNEERILTYCTHINKTDLVRRLGSIYELMGYKAILPELQEYLDALHTQMQTRPNDYRPIPLLEGYSASNNINSWGIALP